KKIARILFVSLLPNRSSPRRSRRPPSLASRPCNRFVLLSPPPLMKLRDSF
ncbi:unnamed protein product, partial [Arabidopsis halleri]